MAVPGVAEKVGARHDDGEVGAEPLEANVAIVAASDGGEPAVVLLEVRDAAQDAVDPAAQAQAQVDKGARLVDGDERQEVVQSGGTADAVRGRHQVRDVG